MNYYELRSIVSRLIPGALPFDFPRKNDVSAVREKGRKSNYHQFNLVGRQWEKRERLLNTQEIRSFVEISIRAAACPMPMNADTWDGLKCQFGCRYCVPSSAKVLMADGTEKYAGRVREGDHVMSYNTETGKPEVAVVEETMSRIAESLIRIKTDSTELAVTPEHPVFTRRGWIRADELTENDEVVVW